MSSSSPQHDNHTAAARQAEVRSWLADVGGIASFFVGVVFALVKFDGWTSKLLGCLFALTMAAMAYFAARDHARHPLSISTRASMLAVVVTAVILMTALDNVAGEARSPAASSSEQGKYGGGTTGLPAQPGSSSRGSSAPTAGTVQPTESSVTYNLVYNEKQLRLRVGNCWDWTPVDLDIPTVGSGYTSNDDDLQYTSCGDGVPTLEVDNSSVGADAQETSPDPRKCQEQLEFGKKWATKRNPRTGARFCVFTNRERVVFLHVVEVDSRGSLTVKATAWEPSQ